MRITNSRNAIEASSVLRVIAEVKTNEPGPRTLCWAWSGFLDALSVISDNHDCRRAAGTDRRRVGQRFLAA